jgi:hypothetical protein
MPQTDSAPKLRTSPNTRTSFAASACSAPETSVMTTRPTPSTTMNA